MAIATKTCSNFCSRTSITTPPPELDDKMTLALSNGHANGPGYADQLEAFRKSDADRDALVQDIIGKYETLQLAYQEKCDDLSNEVEARRLWQSKASANGREVAELKQAAGSNSFVVVILDGDGAIFQDYLWAQGKDGGSDAAHQLHAAIKNELRSTYPDANVEDWQILVHVVLNLSGLAQTLWRCGIASSVNEVLDFGRNFGLAQPMFSFIDVGAGKERADHKIRETLRLFLPQAQCKHVFFGPTHDNGYLVVLERYKREYASRLTLIETTPSERGFANLGLKIVKFPQIFRREELSDRHQHQNITSSAPPLAPIRTQSNNLARQMQPTSAVFVPGTKSPSPAPSAESGASSWATVGKSNTAKTIDIAPKKAPVRKHMFVNMHDERVDELLPQPDHQALKRFNERMKENARDRHELTAKCCNEHHLAGRCSKGEDYCDYSHGPKLTPGELLVLKHKAKSLMCPDGSNCRDIDCYRGHHCNRHGKGCTLGSDCYFFYTHKMDFRPAKRVFEDGSEEWLQSFLNGQSES